MQIKEEKIIKIFLSSSLEDVREDRDELESFIGRIARNLRDRYKSRGVLIDIVPLNCEDYNPELNGDGNTAEFRELLAGCDICVFLVFSDADKSTVEEFRLARELYDGAENGKPKIYTYFKQVSGAEIKESVSGFMDELDKAFSHFWSTFENIDTVKLGLILNLSILNEGFIQVEFEDGQCLINGDEKLDLSKVSQFANNRELQLLKSQREELEKEYIALKPKYSNGSATEQESRRYADIAAKRQNLIELIDELEKGIFNLSYQLCKDESRGELTLRQREAYRHFEQGDFEGALAILNNEDIDSDFEREEKKMAQKAAVYIREHKTAIEILSAMRLFDGRFKEIEIRYEKIISVAEKYLVELDVIYDYASYLYTQGKSKAYDIAILLKNIYENHPDICSDYDKAALYNLIGIICYNSSTKHKEAEEYYLKALEIREELAAENPERYNLGLASNCNNIGLFYKNQGQPQKAEKYYLKSLEIRKELAAENPERYNSDLADSCNNIGVFYKDQGQPKKAEKYYLKAIEISEELAAENPERYNSYLADSCNNIGVFYKEQEKPKKAEEYFLKAIEIREELAAENPERYNSYLAESCNNIGLFYYNQGQPQKAEKYYLKSLGIYEELADENPERYNSDLASSCNNIGIFYKNQGQPQKAEDYYLRANNIFDELAVENPERYNFYLAGSCNNIGLFYNEQGQPQKAEEYYLKALKIREELAAENPERYNSNLADSFNNIGLFYNDQGQPQKAEKYYLKSLEIRKELADENPERYNSYLARSCDNIGVFYNEQGQPDKAEKYYLKAFEIRAELADENPERYNSDLAMSCNNIGNYYSDQGQPDKAEKYHLKALEIYEELAAENPDRYNSYLAISYWNFGLFKEDAAYKKKAYELAKTALHHPYCRRIVEIYESDI